MKLRKSALGLAGVGAVLTAAAVFSATTASAAVGVSTTGAFLACKSYNDGNGAGHAVCALTDTAADSHSVYANLQVDGYAGVRYNNTGGNGTTLNFTYWFGTDTPHWDLYYRACRNVQRGVDNCSGWVHIRA